MRRTPIVLPKGLSIHGQTIYSDITEEENNKMRELFDSRMKKDSFLRKLIKSATMAFLVLSLVAYFSLAVGKMYIGLCLVIVFALLIFLSDYAVAAYKHNSFKKYLAYRK